MSGNGYYDGQFEKLMRVVDDIDRRTEQHERETEMCVSHLEAIAQNTKTIAERYSTDNRELSKLAAGKNQVSIHVFIVLMLLCGAYVLIEKVSQAEVDIHMPFIGLDITHRKTATGD